MESVRNLQWWFVHLAVFVVAQGIFLAVGQSWPAAFLTGGAPEEAPILMDVSRWWLIVFAIDTAWSMYKAFSGGSASAGSR